MWDFIIPNEETQEALTVTTQSKNPLESSQRNPKQKASMPPPRDKEIGKKFVPKSTQNTPTQLDPFASSKTLRVFEEMEYNIIGDMKKTRANITFHQLRKFKHQQKLLLKELKAIPTSPRPATIIS